MSVERLSARIVKRNRALAIAIIHKCSQSVPKRAGLSIVETVYQKRCAFRLFWALESWVAFLDSAKMGVAQQKGTEPNTREPTRRRASHNATLRHQEAMRNASIMAISIPANVALAVAHKAVKAISCDGCGQNYNPKGESAWSPKYAVIRLADANEEFPQAFATYHNTGRNASCVAAMVQALGTRTYTVGCTVERCTVNHAAQIARGGAPISSGKGRGTRSFEAQNAPAPRAQKSAPAPRAPRTTRAPRNGAAAVAPTSADSSNA